MPSYGPLGNTDLFKYEIVQPFLIITIFCLYEIFIWKTCHVRISFRDMFSPVTATCGPKSSLSDNEDLRPHDKVTGHIAK